MTLENIKISAVLVKKVPEKDQHKVKVIKIPHSVKEKIIDKLSSFITNLPIPLKIDLQDEYIFHVTIFVEFFEFDTYVVFSGE